MKFLIIIMVNLMFLANCDRKETINHKDETLIPKITEQINLPDSQNIILESIQVQDEIIPKKKVRRVENNTIYSIAEYIENELNLRKGRNYTTLEDLLISLNINNEYEIIEKRFLEQFKDNIAYLYKIKSGHYNLHIFGSETYEKYFLTYIEIIISEENILHLFPYDIKEDYLKDNNFGDIYRHGIDIIEYKIKEDTWFLKFYYDKLYSIEFEPYMT